MFGHEDEGQKNSNSNAQPVASAATAPVYSDPDPLHQLGTTTPSNDAPASDTPSIAPDSLDSLSLDKPGAKDETDSADTAEGKKEIDQNIEALSPAGGYPQTTSARIRPGGESDEEEEVEETPKIKPVEELKPPEPAKPEEPDTPATTDDDLPAIRQQVISELFPLIDELDQTPEERFRTLMMVIQATDNQSLIKAAYESAHNISDVKKKAQALLDILNEINYFTLPPNQEEQIS